MHNVPAPVAEFLRGERIAVTGVSRDPHAAANAIYRALERTGHTVVPVNPHTETIDGTRCYPDVASIPGALDGVVIASPPESAVDIVRQCGARGVDRVWMHRSFGHGSVSEDAVRESAALGVECIVGGCPLMYCENADIAHRCMRWVLGLRGRVPR